MQIYVNKLRENAILPTHGSEAAAGYDLYACAADGMSNSQVFTVYPHKTTYIGTGLAMAIPEGYFGALFARSGLASEEGLRPANCVGVIDSDYRGEIKVAMHNDTEELHIVSPNDRIAQLVILPCFMAEFVEGLLSATERGSGGFGSTGKA